MTSASKTLDNAVNAYIRSAMLPMRVYLLQEQERMANAITCRVRGAQLCDCTTRLEADDCVAVQGALTTSKVVFGHTNAYIVQMTSRMQVIKAALLHRI